MAVLLLFTSVSVMEEFSCNFVYLNLNFSWFRMLKSDLKYVEGGIKKFNPLYHIIEYPSSLK